ncbi:hypothetical protein GCM10009787_29000 [Streptomyces bangladeshensis]|uniref:Uncharacterized protein n=1 Tax=Streptomyces bangladeshensis TaxID=295352 RepID=A0ABN3BGS9_9ACTN
MKATIKPAASMRVPLPNTIASSPCTPMASCVPADTGGAQPRTVVVAGPRPATVLEYVTTAPEPGGQGESRFDRL